MIEPGIRDAPLPAIHRRGWRFDELGKLGEPTEVFYDFVAEFLHDRDNAIIATCRQALMCDKRNSKSWPTRLNGRMDIETLKRLMNERGETQAGIARLLGITPDKLSKTLAGKRNLQLREANILIKYFNLDDPKEVPTMLPIVGLISAGSWREGFETIMGYMPSPDRALSKDAFVVIVEGDSMDKVAKSGEGIIIDPSDRDLCDGRYYVIRNGDGETTFKQYREGPARFEPCSTNPIHTPIYPGREEFTVIGRAKKRVSDL